LINIDNLIKENLKKYKEEKLRKEMDDEHEKIIMKSKQV